jgi:hypothetical protein
MRYLSVCPGMRAIPTRISQPWGEASLPFALTAPASERCSSSSTPSPKATSFAWRDSEGDAGQSAVRFTYSLRLQTEWGETTGYVSTAIRLQRHPERHRVLQTSVSVKRHLSRIFPTHPRSLALVLIPRPAARRDSAFSAFRKSFRQEPAKRAERKDFPNLPKMRRLALGSGAHSRRRAQECPEGNPGKYKPGETQWHSTYQLCGIGAVLVSAIRRADPGRRAPAATDVTISWFSIVPHFRWRAWPALPRFERDDLVSAHLQGLR